IRVTSSRESWFTDSRCLIIPIPRSTGGLPLGSSPDLPPCRGLALEPPRLPDHDGVLSIHFLQQHAHVLVLARRNVLADVVGADRELAVAPVHQHRELDLLGPAEV